MAVFHMSSDGYFVLTFPSASSVDVYVLDYSGDIYDPDLIRNNDINRWRGSSRIKIGPSDDAQFRALEVHGVVIEGDQLTQLWNDLTLTAVTDGRKFCLAANRNGICYLLVNSPSVMRLRVNDYFGWAKYGVKHPISTSTIWNKCDLSTGATLVDIGQLLKNKEKEMQEKGKELTNMEQLVACKKEMEENNMELAACKKELEEKNMELVACKKELEEKDLELTACKKELDEKGVELTACKKDLEWSKKMESLFNKLVEAKEKEVEMVNSQLLAFKPHHKDVE